MPRSDVSFEHIVSAVPRFQQNYDAGAADECWIWRGKRNGRGYGSMKVAGYWFLASRIAVMLSAGRILGRWEFACHRCDNPPCVNPNHLFVGSPAENMWDMVVKGRTNTLSYARRKLTAAQVKAIRGTHNLSAVQIGRAYGVSNVTILRVKKRLIYKEVP